MSWPWQDLKYLKKIEITAPPTRKGGILASLEESNETVEWSNKSVITSSDRRLRLTDEVVSFHYDYPEDFKKLVFALDGDMAAAYECYLALQKPVPANLIDGICEEDCEREDEVYEW